MNKSTKVFRIVFILFVAAVIGFTIHFMTRTKAPWNKESAKNKVENLSIGRE